jgi:hypothetical protein
MTSAKSLLVAEAHCCSPFGGSWVYSNNLGGASETCRLDRTDSYAAATHHDHSIASGHSGRVGDRSGSGQDATAQK